jgi:two-component system sensor histidine kinase/response regulator
MLLEKEIDLRSKILVVDDDPLNILIVKDVLSSQHELAVAMSGAEALKKLEFFTPDIVLLDIMMPNLDGYEVAKLIRKKFPDSHIKIIFISAKMNLRDRLEGYETGADDYITKPYDDGELLAKIRLFIKLKQTQDNLVESKKHLEILNNTLEEKVRLRTDQLIEAEKLSSIGKYAAGIVHNLNNPLAAVIGYSQLIMNSPKMQQHPEFIKWLGKIIQSSDLMKDIIASILTKGKAENSIAEQEIDMNEVLHVLIDILNANYFFKNQVELKLNFGEIPKIQGVYIHFSQSFGNIINNAVDSMFESPNKILNITTKRIDNKVIVEIKDTGCGIPKANLEKIYDPFFTTKPLNTSSDRPSGTGLGMASSKQMLEAYQCEIQIESEVGVGTLFRILIPIEH